MSYELQHVDFTQRGKGGKDRKGFDGGSRNLSGDVKFRIFDVGCGLG